VPLTRGEDFFGLVDDDQHRCTFGSPRNVRVIEASPKFWKAPG
jgi:hypothetical protein